MASSSLPIYTYTSARSGTSYSTNTPGGIGGVYNNGNYKLTDTKQPVVQQAAQQAPPTGLTVTGTQPTSNTLTDKAPNQQLSNSVEITPAQRAAMAQTVAAQQAVTIPVEDKWYATVAQQQAQQAPPTGLSLTGTQPTSNTLAALGSGSNVPVTQPVAPVTPVTPVTPVAQPVAQPVAPVTPVTQPQGITSDQLNTAITNSQSANTKAYSDALAANQTALTSQNANFLKDWNTSADALKTNILSGVDTKNQAFGTQATQGFMDAFKNFQIPTNQQTGVNMGNYNDNRNAAADQWWSQYVTGRR